MAKKVPAANGKMLEPVKEAEASPADLALTPERIRAATGTDNSPLQLRLLDQVWSAGWMQKGGDQDDAILAILAALEAIAPADGVEGMLATQMVATHEAAMECLRRAMIPDQLFEGRDVNLKHAEKLLQIYARQMEALDKHRNRGQQRITVEHVTVQAGGQAIVGNVQAPLAAPAEAASGPLAISHQAPDTVPLPDPLVAPKRVRQAAPRTSK